tara:strand:+ start:10758 stop:11252 length:495 start_codon:yes stop_codon:yes gene_type:complete
MAAHDDVHALKQHLFDAYGGFSDKRIKNLDKGKLFIVDDRRESGDNDARGALFYWFCQMFAEVESANEVQLIMRGGIPHSSAIQAWVEDGNAQFDESIGQLTITVQLGRDEEKLHQLSKLVHDIVKPGAPWYSEKSYKYVCPRVAGSLTKLARVLEEFDSAEEP